NILNGHSVFFPDHITHIVLRPRISVQKVGCPLTIRLAGLYPVLRHAGLDLALTPQSILPVNFRNPNRKIISPAGSLREPTDGNRLVDGILCHSPIGGPLPSDDGDHLIIHHQNLVSPRYFLRLLTRRLGSS